MEWSDIKSGTLYGIKAQRHINPDYTDTIFLSFQIEDRIYSFREIAGYNWQGEFTTGNTKKPWSEDFKPVQVSVFQRLPERENLQDGIIIKSGKRTLLALGKSHAETAPYLVIASINGIQYSGVYIYHRGK